MKRWKIIEKFLKLGSSKSGNYGHKGRPGQRGGSAARGGASMRYADVKGGAIQQFGLGSLGDKSFRGPDAMSSAQALADKLEQHMQSAGFEKVAEAREIESGAVTYDANYYERDYPHPTDVSKHIYDQLAIYVTTQKHDILVSLENIESYSSIALPDEAVKV